MGRRSNGTGKQDEKSDPVTVVNGKVTDLWDATQCSLIDVSEDLSAYIARMKLGKNVYRESRLKNKLFYLVFDRLSVRILAETRVISSEDFGGSTLSLQQTSVLLRLPHTSPRLLVSTCPPVHYLLTIRP
jgi:hypothetical protein